MTTQKIYPLVSVLISRQFNYLASRGSTVQDFTIITFSLKYITKATDTLVSELDGHSNYGGVT